MSLRNGYDKNITAFAVSVNGLIVLSDFVYSEGEDRRSLAPGAVYTRWFGNVRRSVHREAAAQEDFDIKVLAVVLDDKSSDGDEKAVGFLLSQRLKSKQLLIRIVDLLNKENEDLSLVQTSDDTVAAELRSRISSLSDDPNDSSDINDVMRWLSQPASGLSSRERTAQVREICKNLISRL